MNFYFMNDVWMLALLKVQLFYQLLLKAFFGLPEQKYLTYYKTCQLTLEN